MIGASAPSIYESFGASCAKATVLLAALVLDGYRCHSCLVGGIV